MHSGRCESFGQTGQSPAGDGGLDRLDLIDEYRFLVHPRLHGHGPTLLQTGLPGTRQVNAIGTANLKTPTSIAVALQIDGLGRDSRPALRKLDKPALFVNRGGPAAVAIATAVKEAVPTARLEVMDGVGHALFLDDFGRCDGLLQDFLRTLSAR